MCGPDSEGSQVNPLFGHGIKRSSPDQLSSFSRRNSRATIQSSRTPSGNRPQPCVGRRHSYLEPSPLVFGISPVPHSSNIFVSSLRGAFFFERNIGFDVYGSPIHKGFGSSIVNSTFSGQPLHSSVGLLPYFDPLCICHMDAVGPRDYPTRK